MAQLERAAHHCVAAPRKSDQKNPGETCSGFGGCQFRPGSAFEMRQSVRWFLRVPLGERRTRRFFSSTSAPTFFWAGSLLAYFRKALAKTQSFKPNSQCPGGRSTQIPNIEVECWGRLSLAVPTSRRRAGQSTRAQRLSGADQRQLHKLAVQPGVV